ncbi:FkbM family methyltransferase [Micromonospora sp. STR1s_5]|nr:FkbM family methyltransferase [Micromonospora sp. STR1s_5]
MLKKIIKLSSAKFANLVGRISGGKVTLAVSSQLYRIPEEVHLKKFFDHFDIDFVLDVGANRGQYASMLRRIGYNGPIVSVEPTPDIAAHLRQISASDTNWFIEELALSDKQGETSFNIMSESEFSSLNSPDNSEIDIFRSSNHVTRTVQVRVGTVAEMIEKYQSFLSFRRPFLKLDTQGSDLRVVVGAGNTICRFRGLQSELSVIPIYKEAPSYIEAIAYYESVGFKLSALVPNNAGHFPDLVEIDCIMYRP